MNQEQIISWLLEGEVSIQYQVHRDLLGIESPDLQRRIHLEGWGKQYLEKRNEHGHWGKKYYEPKWISTHYTLLDIRNLNPTPSIPIINETIQKILKEEKAPDGGIRPIGTTQKSDVCINGMFLNFASYFQAEAKELESVVDFILSEKMADGGFNCQRNRKGARHSSLHSTISTLEGITSYEKNGYTYRLEELLEAKKSSIEFILLHQLFISDRTGEIIKKEFLKLSYPSRWKFDILRALDYFQLEGVKWDNRMQAAIDYLLKKRRKDGTWTVQSKHAGKIHFEMEKAGKPSRWNTLRALRVLKHFDLLV
ncbi:MAG: prenyltransferase/squalene oxidase repeat-containing protein [Bacteroidota bacterium]